MKGSAILVTLSIVVSGCGRAPSASSAPSPTRTIQIAASPAKVLERASSVLRTAGFTVTPGDGNASRLTAEREQGTMHSESIGCVGAAQPTHDVSERKVFVALAAVPGASGQTTLTLTARLRTSYLRMSADPRRPDSMSDCQLLPVLVDQLTSVEAGGSGAVNQGKP
jgi:hypothetical protein